MLAQAQLGRSAADERGEAERASECWVLGKLEGNVSSGPASVAAGPLAGSCHRESLTHECAPRYSRSSSKTDCLGVRAPSAQPRTSVSHEEGNTQIKK